MARPRVRVEGCLCPVPPIRAPLPQLSVLRLEPAFRRGTASFPPTPPRINVITCSGDFMVGSVEGLIWVDLTWVFQDSK
ncbi:unnamed protein product, partial [Nesidiocoris tenuis]